MSVNDLQSRIGSRRRMASTIAGDIDGAHRKRSRKDDKPADRGLPENAVEDRRHRRPFKDSERKRPERRRSRTRSPPPPPPPAGGGGGGGGGGRHRSSNTPPRSRSHFQNDQHRSAAHGDENPVRRAYEHGRWSQPEDKVRAKAAPSDLEKKNEKSKPLMDNNNVWKHDGYHELEAEAPATRKRPAFREKKMKVEEAADYESVRPPRHDRPASSSDKREEERSYNPHGLGRHERPVAGIGDRDLRRVGIVPRRTETPRHGYQSREKHNGSMGSKARDDYNGRQNRRNTFQSGGGFQVEKWKHDLFDEANKSPNQKNEEEQIAKVEALLAL